MRASIMLERVGLRVRFTCKDERSNGSGVNGNSKKNTGSHSRRSKRNGGKSKRHRKSSRSEKRGHGSNNSGDNGNSGASNQVLQQLLAISQQLQMG